MNKPLPPADGACCENGCDPCVWDIYYAALRDWETQQALVSPKEPTAPTAPAPT